MMLGGGPAGSGGSTGTFTGGGAMGGRGIGCGGVVGAASGVAGAVLRATGGGAPGAGVSGVAAGGAGLAAGAEAALAGGVSAVAGAAGSGLAGGVWAVTRPAQQRREARKRYMKVRLENEMRRCLISSALTRVYVTSGRNSVLACRPACERGGSPRFRQSWNEAEKIVRVLFYGGFCPARERPGC